MNKLTARMIHEAWREAMVHGPMWEQVGDMSRIMYETMAEILNERLVDQPVEPTAEASRQVDQDRNATIQTSDGSWW